MSAKTRKAQAARSQADPQQQATYRWEESWKAWGQDNLTLGQCRLWVEAACGRYGVAPPRVRRHRSKAFSWCHVELRIISFGQGGRNAATALHETAHLIAYERFGEKITDHGPTFLGVYMWLLEWAEVAPRVALHASARSHKLKWRRGFGPKRCNAS